jgi:hypothetical protein
MKWESNGLHSIDGEWSIHTDREREGEPRWTYFARVPLAVIEYRAAHPGDTDAWLGQYSVSLEEMHQQAEALMTKVTKKKTKK